ncbi:MAG: acyl-CoA thioesterase [Candidatus Omnitrophota bacterium]
MTLSGDAKKVGESRTEMSQLMLPQHANMAGTVYGGTILSIADSVAYVCASRHAGPHCVTVSVDRVDFHEPIRIGEVVTFQASVNYVGRASIKVGIKIIAEDLRKGLKRHTNSCYFTMVCVDENGRPKSVPRLLPESEEEKRRYREGEARHNADRERFRK